MWRCCCSECLFGPVFTQVTSPSLSLPWSWRARCLCGWARSVSTRSETPSAPTLSWSSAPKAWAPRQRCWRLKSHWYTPKIIMQHVVPLKVLLCHFCHYSNNSNTLIHLMHRNLICCEGSYNITHLHTVIFRATETEGRERDREHKLQVFLPINCILI